MRWWIRTASLALVILLAGQAAARAQGRQFRILLVPERNVFEQQRKYKNLCDYTCSLLPIEFTFDVMKGYKDVLEAMGEGKADGAFMGSFIAAFSIDNYGYIPLFRPVWSTGESHYSSYIFKRAGLPVTRDVNTWKGRSFAFVDPLTSAGYFFPLKLLRDNGVRVPAEFFSRVQFAGSHDAAVWMVANDIVEMGAAKNTVFMELVRRRPDLGEKVELLYNEGHYPDSTLVVVGSTPVEVREALTNVFLRMHSNQEGREVLKLFGAQRFVKASTADYDEVRNVVRGSGQDIRGIELLDK